MTQSNSIALDLVFICIRIYFCLIFIVGMVVSFQKTPSVKDQPLPEIRDVKTFTLIEAIRVEN